MMERIGAMFMHELTAARDFLRRKWGFTPTPQQIMVELPGPTHHAEALGRFTLNFEPDRDPHHSRVLRRTRRMKSLRMYRRNEHPRASYARIAAALSSHATRKIVERRAKIKQARAWRKINALA